MALQDNSTYTGLAVPIYPKDGTLINQTGTASAYDIVTIKRGSGATGHSLALQDWDGNIRLAVTKNFGILTRVRTTRPTTGLTKGELMTIFHGSKPYLAMCTSTAGQQIKLLRMKTKTFGRATN